MYHLRHTRDYEALDVPIGSDKATVKKAYRNLAKVSHSPLPTHFGLQSAALCSGRPPPRTAEESTIWKSCFGDHFAELCSVTRRGIGKTHKFSAP